MGANTTTTYSMWSHFRNCRKACEWRYLKELVPLERDHNLHFGAAIHECLELWHRHRDLDRVLEHSDTLYPERLGDEKQRADWHLATAMMKRAMQLGVEAPAVMPIRRADASTSVSSSVSVSI